MSFDNSFILMAPQRMFKACFTMLQTQNAFVIHILNFFFNVSNLHKEKLTFERLNIVIIGIFKFQKRWIKCMMVQPLIHII
jgi:hypothetical protein